MDKLKTTGAMITALLAFFSALFPLIGYLPPVPIDKMLHLTPDQIGLGLALISNFLRPLHQLVPEVWAMAMAIFQGDNRRADEAFTVILNANAAMRQQMVGMQAQIDALSKAGCNTSIPLSAIPPSQTGRMGLGSLFVAFALSAAVSLGAGSLLSGCSTTQQAQVQTGLQRAQVAMSRVCPVLQATVVTAQAFMLAPDVAASVTAANEVIKGVCAAGTDTSFANLQVLANSALPKLDAAVRASTLDDSTKQRVIVNLGVANSLINEMLASLPAAAVAPAPAASS